MEVQIYNMMNLDNKKNYFIYINLIFLLRLLLYQW